ncbi:MAG TPA: DinB family protein [Acidimicrobiales bacterium]
MTSVDLLSDAFDRIRDAVHPAVQGLTTDELAARLDAEANSIAWLVWHLTRIQDDHVAGVAGTEQAWTADGWVNRFGLPFDDGETGYGQGPDDVAQVRADATLLTGYHDAVHARTIAYLQTVADDDLATVVDGSWDPPVTLATRLVSVIADDLQHVGQAAVLRGVIARGQ